MAINLPNGLLKLLGIDPSTIEISLSEAGNSFNGTNANEHILGNGGGDSINAGGGSDIVEGGAGGDSLNGATGNDYIEGGAGGDSLNGGAGIDTVGYSQSDFGVAITLNGGGGGQAAGGDAQGDSIGGFENIVGSLLADTITGNNSANVLAGLAGNDTLRGMGDNDVLIGGIGADVLDGGTGIDTADYSTSANPVHLLLGGVSSGGDAQGDTFISIEKFVGTAGADVFDGSASLTGFSADGGGGADTMIGGHGNDTLSIGGAAAAVAGFAALQEEGATIEGGDGNDTITGGDGDDVINDGDGNDNVFAGGGNDTLFVGNGIDSVNGGSGDDHFVFMVLDTDEFASPLYDGGPDQDSMDYRNLSSGVEVTLTDVPDEMLSEMQVMLGGATRTYNRISVETDVLTEFDDTLNGDSNNNTVFGEAGNDAINGGAGDDTIIGGIGADILTGGEGADRFVFFFDSESIDTLNDAGDHDDIIDLRAIDGNLVEDGHQPLTFDQIELTEEAIIITLITGGESAFALDQGATMRINENGGEYALADIQLI